MSRQFRSESSEDAGVTVFAGGVDDGVRLQVFGFNVERLSVDDACELRACLDEAIEALEVRELDQAELAAALRRIESSGVTVSTAPADLAGLTADELPKWSKDR